jgi:ABC-type oligopeptide transport system ATPase subunit
MLRLEGVSKVFKAGTFGGTRVTAVADVSFELRPGEVVSLIGESGSGKTSIGRMVLRLTDVSSGSIFFDGRDIAGIGGRGLRQYYSSVQGVFQDPFSSYNPVFKADRIFELIRRPFLSHIDDEEWNERLHASLRGVGLEPAAVLGKFPHQLSGGQLQRLLIARALMLYLKLLVADEIISMLDASTRTDVLNILGDLASGGLAVLFITHDLSLGHYISDRTVILRRGRIVETGATKRVFASPRHSYTKMLLDSVPQVNARWSNGRTPRAPRPDDDAIGPLVEVEPGHFAAAEVW